MNNSVDYATVVPTRQKKNLDAMIPLGDYDQLSLLLNHITSQTYRAKIIDRILQLTTEDTNNIKNNNKIERTTLTSPPKTTSLYQKHYDVFIAHASEDKDFVSPLALSLIQKDLRIWYDDFVLELGDSLRREIDRGLAQSQYGVVILSYNFFNKDWPQKELDGLTSKEQLGKKVILPIWHEIDKEVVASYSPTLAGIVAAKSSLGVEAVADKIIKAISH